ncbi:MAG TPA: FG-GAP-like repeat-containing protein, partial [Anaerolineae bacterium]|nr:FG-GAP-like repeat-containing protein [Anaerolineae bacterium]
MEAKNHRHWVYILVSVVGAIWLGVVVGWSLWPVAVSEAFVAEWGKLVVEKQTGVVMSSVAGPTFAPGQTLNTFDNEAVAVGDLNGDGWPDIVTGPADRGGRVWLNEGGVMVLQEQILIAGGTGVQALALGDIDGDGDLDLVQGMGGPSYDNLIWRNNGRGEFTMIQDLKDGLWTNDVTLGDVDGDGDLDLFTANNVQPAELWLNDGSGGFTLGWSTSSNGYRVVVLADLDGDRDLDGWLGKSGSSSSQLVLINNGSGVFVEQSYTTGSVYGGDLGDIDGDGDFDLIEVQGGSISVRENDGTGTFSQLYSVPNLNNGRWGVFGDLDNDGDLDFMVANEYGATNVFVMDNNVFTISNQALSGLGRAELALADFDHDGDIDTVLAGANGTRIWLNQHNVNFVDSGQRLLNPVATLDGTTGGRLGDIDGDGDLDLVVSKTPLRTFAANQQVWKNDGEGGFTLSQELPVTKAMNDIALGDIDGDLDLDLVVVGPISGYIWLNDGDGYYPMVHQNLATGGLYVELADLDGDADLDMVLGEDGDGDRHTVWFNNGTGTMVFGYELGDPSRAIALGDMDNDNDIDIVTGELVWLNDGSGSFTDVPHRLGGDHISLGDLDGDGDLDAFVNFLTIGSRVWWNVGDGVLVDSEQSLGAALSKRTSLGDIDGDGDLDAVVANDSADNSLWLNDGNGYFNRVVMALDAENSSDALLGDVDSDGDLDAIFLQLDNNLAEDEPDQVWFNQGHDQFGLPNKPAALVVGRPVTKPVVAGEIGGPLPLFSTQVISVPYILFEAEEDSVVELVGQYSFNGGGAWEEAVAATGSLTQNISMASGLYFDGIDDYVPVSSSGDINIGEHPTRTVMMWFKPTKMGVTTTPQILFEEGGVVNGLNIYVQDEAVYAGAWAETNGWTGAYLSQTVTGNEWHHVAVVLSATAGTVVSDGLRVYVDGELVGSVDGASLPSHTDVGGIGDIGGATQTHGGDWGTGSSAPYRGYIDEIQVWNWPLTSAEIRASWYGEFLLGREGLVAHWPLDEGSGTTMGDASGQGVDHSELLGGGVVGRAPQWTPGWFYRGEYVWDTFASGFFGQSHNVVFQLEARGATADTGTAGSYELINQVPERYQRPAAVATSAPFRVRGTQIRVMSGTVGSAVPVAGAVVYRLLEGQLEGATPLMNSGGTAYVTDADGYLRGSGRLDSGGQLVALLPITDTGRYVLYYSSATPNETGLDMFTFDQFGVQTLYVHEKRPLLLFNLDMTLEWDARNDGNFLEDLEVALERAALVLYDVSDGQIGLGDVRVRMERDEWLGADVVMYAQNGIRPRATMGGLVDGLVDDVISPTLTISAAYGPGQVRLGPNWDPFGQNLAELTPDWQRALAHELAHYLLFLPDNYLGIGDNGLPIPVDCAGSFMTNTYDEGYSEFLTPEAWANEPSCAQTIAAQTTERSDWETVTHFYGALRIPTSTNSGPVYYPLAVTNIIIEGEGTSAVLPPVNIDIRDGVSGALRRLAGGQGYLLQTQGTSGREDDRLLPLGGTTGGGDRIKVRGAREGDTLCVVGRYDPVAGTTAVGCLSDLTAEDRSLFVNDVADWQPNIRADMVTTQTLAVTVTVPTATGQLRVQLYPAYGEPGATVPVTSPIMMMTSNDGMTFTAQLDLGSPTFEGWIRVSNFFGTQQAFTQFFLNPPWGP